MVLVMTVVMVVSCDDDGDYGVGGGYGGDNGSGTVEDGCNYGRGRWLGDDGAAGSVNCRLHWNDDLICRHL